MSQKEKVISFWVKGEEISIMKSKLAVLLVFAVAGLLSFLLWWLVWGGSGALSGRASITKDGAAEPVANADIFLMEASEQVADFRKAVTGYIRAISVTRQVEGEVNAANESAVGHRLLT